MNLLLAGDDAALAAELRGRGHRVAIVADARAVRRALDGDAFDGLVLAWPPPRSGSVALVRQLREDALFLPVLVLGARDGAIEALDAGADDVLARPVLIDELIARLNAARRARGWTSGSDTIRAGDITVSPARCRAWRGPRALDLAQLELALLAELVRHADTVLPRATLLARVWRTDTAPTTNLVETYIYRLRTKLTAAGEPDPIVTKRRQGYMLRA